MNDINDTLIPMLPPIEVQHVVATLAEVTDYNHKLLGVPEMWKTTRGRGIKVAILDTGRPVHNDITVAGSKSFIPGYEADTQGHATHVGGIVAAVAGNNIGVQGIAPESEDYYSAVLNANGQGTINQIVAGIHWAVDEVKADIINMSLGIPGTVGDIPALKAACQYAYDKGVILIAAAGNEAGKIGQPARYPTVISVAAVNDQRQHARFSNSGPEIDFAAGGVNVYSCYPGNRYARLSGTSMASPALAGMAALILSEHLERTGRRMTFNELYAELRRLSTDIGSEGFDHQSGHGLPVFKKRVAPLPPPDPEPEPDPQPRPGRPEIERGDCRRFLGGARVFIDAVESAVASGESAEAAVGHGVARAATYLERTDG